MYFIQQETQHLACMDTHISLGTKETHVVGLRSLSGVSGVSTQLPARLRSHVGKLAMQYMACSDGALQIPCPQCVWCMVDGTTTASLQLRDVTDLQDDAEQTSHSSLARLLSPAASHISPRDKRQQS